MTHQLAALGLDNEDLENDWCWEVECSRALRERIKRLETAKLSRFEIYEELLELMAELEIYWRGLSEDRQKETAKECREILRRCEASKERIQTWARKELARRLPRTRRVIGEDVPNTFGDTMKALRKDFRARHPKRGIF
jgi:hypothetical protein